MKFCDFINNIGINKYKNGNLNDYKQIIKHVHKFETVFIDSHEIMYKLQENIYIYIDYRYRICLVYYAGDYTYDIVNDIINNITESNMSYYTYVHINNFNKYFKRFKKIENDTKLDSNIDNIVNNIVNKVLNYNISVNIVLHGNPGTGKSSCIEIIAKRLNSNVYILPINDDLLDAVKELGTIQKSVILIPELDKHIGRNDEKYKEYEQIILELLCGCYSVKNSIIAITCNDINKLRQNPIMTRPGRVHSIIEFPMITLDLIKNIVLKYYPDHIDFSIFHKYVNKVSVAEFNTAILNSFINDKKLDSNFEVYQVEYNKSSHLYL